MGHSFGCSGDRSKYFELALLGCGGDWCSNSHASQLEWHHLRTHTGRRRTATWCTLGGDNYKCYQMWLFSKDVEDTGYHKSISFFLVVQTSEVFKHNLPQESPKRNRK